MGTKTKQQTLENKDMTTIWNAESSNTTSQEMRATEYVTTNGYRYDNNNDNATKYIVEFKKQNILNWTNRTTKNLVEVLTNNGITSASNPTLSLPQSSSMFPGYRNKVIPTE